MGDRGNIKIGKVYLYTHWGGSEIKQILQKALKRKERWNDEPYLTRIIFCELCDDYPGETGYGISTRVCDNEHNIIEVDCENQKVKELHFDFDEDYDKRYEDMKIVKEWTFEEFISKAPRN